MRKIKENGIGSNYRTVNNNPISPFNDDRVSVEIYPSAWEKVNVNVTCDELGYESGLKTFDTDQAARRYAINLHQKLVTALDAKLHEAVLTKLLRQVGF